jgi:hypothetical protein
MSLPLIIIMEWKRYRFFDGCRNNVLQKSVNLRFSERPPLIIVLEGTHNLTIISDELKIW